MTARKVAVITVNTVSKSKTVLEMTDAGLDTRWETTMPLMLSSCNDCISQWHHNYVTIMLCRASRNRNTVFPWHVLYVVAVLEKTWWKTKASRISHRGQFPGQTNPQQDHQHLLSVILVSLRSLTVCLLNVLTEDNFIFPFTFFTWSPHFVIIMSLCE